MIKNYFKISFRNLIKHKSYTAINIIGVALGMAAFLIINQYISFERSYDSFYEDASVIHRVTTDQIVDGQLGTRDAMSFNPTGQVLEEEVPEISQHTLTYNIGNTTFKKGETLVVERSVKMADQHFVDFFGHQVIAGDKATMLKEPNSVVLTQSKARFYFGDEEALGKTLHIYSSFDKDFKVTGVIQDAPQNTHFKFDILLSIETIRESLEEQGWNMFNFYTYVKIDEGTDIAALEQKLVPIKEKYIGEESTLFFNLQPIEEVHLNSDMTFEVEPSGNKKSVDFLEIISIFILIIAWVNYVNLSTAKAVDRAKEVGLRKVIGARKKQLRIQFLVEAFIINLMGALIALTIVHYSSSAFNNLVDQTILLDVWKSTSFLTLLSFFTLIGTFISGFYPAIFLSNFKIVAVLKGKFQNSKSGVGLRKGLVVMQFATSIVLIACTLIVIMQVNFMRQKDLGMDTDNIVTFRNPRNVGGDEESYKANFKVFKERLLNESGISGFTTASVLPGGESDEIWSTSGGVQIVGMTDRLEATTYIQVVDASYFDVLNVSFLNGRNFIKDSELDDTTAVIVNQAFLDRFDLAPGDVLNEKMMFGRDPENDKYPIVGVIGDVHRTTLKQAAEPTAYFYDPIQSRSMVKINPAQVEKSLDHIQATWEGMYPNSSLEFAFLDERFDRLYKEDRRFGTVFSIFSGFALLVAILGLFGLISFIAAQRTKEVGVRKVLGASGAHIVTIFYKEFLVLLGIAALMGFPIVFFGMNNWLDNYAYRIDFPWLVLIVALSVVLLSSLITVSARVLKVASLNPASTLKNE